MSADFKVVLDACVLVSYGLADTYLRLAETPRLYSPIWTPKILDEVHRAQTQRLKPPWPKNIATSFRDSLEKAFPESSVHGWEKYVPIATNDEGDRHVVAAALASGSELIVTFNLRHFPSTKLRPLGIKAAHPEDYLKTLYTMAPAVVFSKIVAIAQFRKKSPEDVLKHLSKSVPAFVELVAEELNLRV